MPIARFVAGPFGGSGGGGDPYQVAETTLFINPSQTAWVAWNDTPSVSRTDGLFPGQTFLWGGGGFGTDDFFDLTVTNNLTTASRTVSMDRNDPFGVSSGQQNVIFGDAAIAPNALRIDAFGGTAGTRRVFNEGTPGDLATSVFTAPADYTFRFAFRDNSLGGGGFGHGNVYLLAQPVFGAPAPSGGIDFNLGPTDPGGDGIVVETDLGVDLKASAKASLLTPPNQAMDQQTARATRSFTFNPQDGGTDPVDVFLNASIDGLLRATQGSASVDLRLNVFDSLGNEIASTIFPEQIPATTPFMQRSVRDIVSLPALLVPGETYEFSASLTAKASIFNPIGEAVSDFNNTVSIVLSGVPIPEPSSLILFSIATISLFGCGRRQG